MFSSSALAEAQESTDEEAPGPADEVMMENELATRAFSQQRYDYALIHLKRELAIRERVVGSVHPSLATVLSNLGHTYLALKEYDLAVASFTRAYSLAAWKDGNNSPAVLNVIRGLGLAHFRAKRLDQAEGPLRQALSIAEHIHGVNSQSITENIINLADLLTARNDLAQAEVLFQRLVLIRRALSGRDRALLGDALDYLANVYRLQKNYEKSIATFEEALRTYVQALGPDHEHSIQCHNNMATAISEFYKTINAPAIEVMKRLLEIQERTLGPTHHQIETQAFALAEAYHSQFESVRAEPYYQRSINALRVNHGKHSFDMARTLHGIAEKYEQFGPQTEAERYYLAALDATDHMTDPPKPSNPTDETLDSAAVLNNLALLYRRLGLFEKAEAAILRGIKLHQSIRGLKSPVLANSIDVLGVIYYQQGRLDQAELQLRHALELRQSALGPKHSLVAETIFNLAEVLWAKGLVKEAEVLHRKALEITENQPERSVYAAAHMRFRLADRLEEQLRDKEAGQLRMTGTNWFSHNVNSVKSDKELAFLTVFMPGLIHKLHTGQADADSRLDDALSTLDGPRNDLDSARNSLASSQDGKDLLDLIDMSFEQSARKRVSESETRAIRANDEKRIAEMLPALAHACMARGLYDRAERVLVHGLRLSERYFGQTFSRNAVLLGDLSRVYLLLHRADKALDAAARAVAIDTQVQGRTTPAAKRRQVLWGRLLGINGKGAEAEALFARLLSKWESEEGRNGASLPSLLHSWALLLMAREAYPQATALLERAVAIGEGQDPAPLADLGVWQENLGRIASKRGDLTTAERLYTDALSSLEQGLGKDHPELIESLISLAELRIKQQKPGDAMTLLKRALAIRERILQRISTEARVITWLLEDRRFEQTTMDLLFSSPSDPQVQRFALTMLLLQKGRALDASQHSAQVLRRAEKDPSLRESVEKLLKIRTVRERLVWSGELEKPQGKATDQRLREQADEIEQQLVARAARTVTLDLPAPEDLVTAIAGSLRNDAALVEVAVARKEKGRVYIACVLLSNQAANCLELGSVEDIDRGAAALQAVLRNPAAQPVSAAQALHRVLWRPLAAAISGRKRIYLSLDGRLNLIPLSALHDGKSYLADSHFFLYLTSGRDLLRSQDAEPTTAPLIVAAPDFSAAHETATKAPPSQVERSGLYTQLSQITPLPGTAEEAKRLQTLLPTARVLLGADAQESAIRASAAPQIVHLATHGIFLVDSGANAVIPSSGRELRALVPLVAAPVAAPSEISKENALSRSALLLAGATRAAEAASTDADGVLTAQEVMSLNLHGTELVVLSACDSGVGAVLDGQGVYGLRRAFFIAGAQSLVTSLWQVDDRETAILMEQYYRYLLQKKGRAEAMQRAAQAVRKRKAHPYFWAPFIVLGREGPLSPL